MRASRVVLVSIAVAVWAATQGCPYGMALAAETSQDRLGEPAAWQPQPNWLPNPSAAARVEPAPEGGLRFAVPEGGRGMKWQRALRRVWLDQQPWLVVRCRASHLQAGADYFLWLEGKEGVTAIRLDQLAADAQWHTVALDAARLLGDESPTVMAVQVQAAPSPSEEPAGLRSTSAAEAWVEIATLAFVEAPPQEAQVLGGAAPAAQDWLPAEHVARLRRVGAATVAAGLAAQAGWQAKPTWLANPATQYSHERREDTDIFGVGDPGLGMKWALYFDQPLDPSGYRYLSLRIRGQGTAIVGDYSISVLGDALPDGRDATTLAPAALAVTEGRWQAVDLPLGPARRRPRLVGIAVQAQAWVGPAILEISDLRFTSARRPRRLEDLLTMRPGWPRGAERVAMAVDLSAALKASLSAAESAIPRQGRGWQGQEPLPHVLSAQEAQARFGLADWFPQESLLIENVPFKVRLGGAAVAATTGDDESEVTVPVSARASEVYLLTLARLTGPEESVRGGGQLLRIGDPDRLRIMLHYADGEARAALPAQAPPPGFGVVDGAQVICVRADPARDLRAIELYVGTPQATLGIAAITLNTTGHRRWEALWRVPALPLVAEAARPLPDLPPSARFDGRRLFLSNRYLEAGFDAAHGLALRTLLHRAIGAVCVDPRDPRPLFGARLGEREISGNDFILATSEPLTESGRKGYRLTYRSAAPALEATITLGIGDEPRFDCEISLRNASDQPQTVAPIGPRLARLAIGRPQDTWYLVPASATILHPHPWAYGGWYSGAEVSLQFLDAFGPARGGGVALMVRDLQSLEKRYQLSPSSSGVEMGLDYQQRTLAPGETYALAPTNITVHTGDWHGAFDAYRAWAHSWYAPAAERPRWWREVFNFRQRFLYGFDALVDPQTRAYRMGPALDEDVRGFGGVDYLHVFDWGNEGPYGRIYSRTGDYDAGDYLPGGWAGFRAAVDGVRAPLGNSPSGSPQGRRGVPVGFYIEGYLLDERGKLGQAHGRDWQMMGPDGALLRWPNSTELFICPAVEPWQEVQATTYARVVERMDADGMYLDEFGFAGPGKWCWSPHHGHRVPSSSMQAEQALTRKVRAAMSAVKPGAVLYTEDTPTDVNSQYQEGSFSYSMQRQRWSGSLAPLKLFRYAFPDFKNMEILNCDYPTGTWATGVGWTFWNGEGLWLEGVAGDWFAPQTLRAIRDCYRVLREHRDAFAGDRAEPLLPTLAGGLYANQFSGASETAYTIYNARNETYSGEVIALAYRPVVRYLDAFAERELQPRLEGGRAYLSLTVGPQGVGCIVERSG